MDMLLFPSVNSKTAQGGADFLSVDCGRVLPCLFCTPRQFIQPFKLMHQGHAISAFSRLSQFFYQFDNVRKVSAVQKFVPVWKTCQSSQYSCTSALLCRPRHKTWQSLFVPSTSRSTNFAYSVFLGCLVSDFKSHSCGLKGVTVIQWYSCICVIRVVSLVPLYH